MKYKIGDRLKRKPGSGFIAGEEPRIVIIADVPENHVPCMPCLVCDAIGCCEWATLWAEDGSHPLYHVSECELEPL